MLSKKVKLEELEENEKMNTTTYASRLFDEPVPKYDIPKESMPSSAAYQLIHDELNMDGNPALNLATFVTTWMEPEAVKLISETLNKNFIDEDEYPQTQKVHDRVINMTARLFNSPADCDSIGTATIGSSEAVMLGLLAHKWSWRNRRKAEGKPYDKPNLVMGADVHTVWEKFLRYFEVEPRIVPLKPDHYILTAEEAASRIDENTITVGAVLGTTFTGQVDEIEKINDLLLKIKDEKGWDIPIHVDAASGGFIAPFVYPDLKWDFRLPRVKSINVSNHKFGLVYPGMGTIVFRHKNDIPEELIFHINYLGGEMPNYSLNFSRGSSMVLMQYYNFLRLGKAGYTRIMTNIMENARYLEDRLVKSGRFELLNDTRYLPVVVVKLNEKSRFDVFQLSEVLRERGWIIPAYTLPPDAQHIAVIRMVIKENFSRDMADLLVTDIMNSVKKLDQLKIEKVKLEKKGRTHRVC